MNFIISKGCPLIKWCQMKLKSFPSPEIPLFSWGAFPKKGCLFVGCLVVGCLIVGCLIVGCLNVGCLIVGCLFAGCLFAEVRFCSMTPPRTQELF